MSSGSVDQDPPESFGQEPESAQLAILRDLAAAAGGESAEDVARSILRLLVDSGIATAACVLIQSEPVCVFVEGPADSVSRLRATVDSGAIDEPLSRRTTSATHSQSGRGDELSIVAEPIPTSAGPPGCLYLLASPGAATVAPIAARQLALALDRAWWRDQAEQLHQQADQRVLELSTIYEIGRAVDSVELDRLLELITEKAARLLDAQACSLMRVNPVTSALTIAASYGLSEDVVIVGHRGIGEGIAGMVAQTGEPLLITSDSRDPRLRGVALRPDIGSSMIVPMKDELGRVIGVLSIRRRKPMRAFDESDLRLLSVFANQASYALNNKQLYDDLDHRVRELSTLSELTQAVISNLDLDCLLNNVADNIVDVVQFDRCCIFLYDRTVRRFVPRILRGYRQDGIGRNSVRMGEGVVGLVAKRQMTIVEVDGRNAMQPMRGFARALGTNSFLAVPIISNPILSKGQTIGVVVADNKATGRPFHSQSIELLTTFVTQAGIAIENAQLHEEWQSRYHDMNRLATQTDNILRSIGLAVAVVDPSGKVARWNRASEQMWGLSERQATSLGMPELVDRFGLPEEEAASLLGMMNQVRETGLPEQRYQVTFHPRRRPEMVANVILSPVLDRQSERQGVVLIVEEITRQFRMESEMLRIRRLADIGQFAAKMAHEVRNPLSSIKGAAQLMRNEYEDMAPFREFLDIIIDEVNHLSKITTDLLDFARPLQLDLHLSSVNELADRTLSFLEGALTEAGVRVNFRPDPEMSTISCDPKQIEQVMRNIIINAIQAMPDGGELIVSTYANLNQPQVTVAFCDNGVGIPEERLDEIFQPFMTTKTKGTGLGLSIVRRIVENHGGSIEVVSRAGEGACFSVILPREATGRDRTNLDRLPARETVSVLPDV